MNDQLLADVLKEIDRIRKELGRLVSLEDAIALSGPSSWIIEEVVAPQLRSGKAKNLERIQHPAWEIDLENAYQHRAVVIAAVKERLARGEQLPGDKQLVAAIGRM